MVHADRVNDDELLGTSGDGVDLLRTPARRCVLDADGDWPVGQLRDGLAGVVIDADHGNLAVRR